MLSRWSYQAGERGHTVTVQERRAGGNLHVRYWSIRDGQWRWKSLRHTDKQRAIRQAHRLAETLAVERDPTSPVTIREVLTKYLQHQTPTKGDREQKADVRRMELWLRTLGGGSTPSAACTRGRWESFVRDRRAGRIDARGHRVPEGKERPVGDRTVEADLVFLSGVLSWATSWYDDDRQGYLLRENPVRGFPAPKEKNPERRVASEDQYQKLLGYAETHKMMTVDGEAPSHLRSLLLAANGTGRRITAICSLRYDDVLPTVGPHGAVRWPADTDKVGREWVVPVSEPVGKMLRALFGKPGLDYLFWAPRDPSKPMTRHLAQKWLAKACDESGLERLGWHAFRRKWASDRRHLSPVDVARAGGWMETRTMERAYQHADFDGMLGVVDL